MAHVATPVSVVTTVDGNGRAWGITVGTLCSLSLAPPLVMCLVKDAEIGTGNPLLYYLREYCSPLRPRVTRSHP